MTGKKDIHGNPDRMWDLQLSIWGNDMPCELRAAFNAQKVHAAIRELMIVSLFPIDSTAVLIGGLQTSYSVLISLAVVGIGAFVALLYSTKQNKSKIHA